MQDDAVLRDHVLHGLFQQDFCAQRQRADVTIEAAGLLGRKVNHPQIRIPALQFYRHAILKPATQQSIGIDSSAAKRRVHGVRALGNGGG